MNDSKSFPIDFVVTWVDGDDPAWRVKKLTFQGVASDEAKSDNRFRDLDLFKYWFRGVELHAPWVRKIFVVTDRQIPEFLNLANPKIQMVDHTEIISDEYLPTFNSNTIDLNVVNIEGLSEHFVLFNDDFFIVNDVSPLDFFTKNGLPKDTIGQSVIIPTEEYDHTLVNNVTLMNTTFTKKQVLSRNFSNFFNLTQGLKVFLLNLYFTPFPKFTRMFDPHTAYSFRKTDVKRGLNVSNQKIKRTFLNRFRDFSDVSVQWLRYFSIGEGNTRPRSTRFGITINTSEFSVRKATKAVKNKKTKILNLQDNGELINIEETVLFFEKKFPKTSTFENVLSSER